MLDLNQVRADFAAYLASNASKRHSLDAALMHVVEYAYKKGHEDAMQVPTVLRHAIAHVDASVAQRNGSAHGATHAAGQAGGIPGAANGAGQGGSAQSGNAAPARGPQGYPDGFVMKIRQHRKGGQA